MLAFYIFIPGGVNERAFINLLGDIMNKEKARKEIKEAGDAVVTYRGENSGKQKYNVVTLNFNTPYIKERRTHAVEGDDSLLVWSWDTDSFRLVKVNLITSIVPLASVLKNHV